MVTVEQLDAAIGKSIRRDSNLTPLAMAVPALSSITLRHLMNNLGAICTRYMEHGVHRGGLFCSTICGNPSIKMAVAVDNWASDETNEEKAEPEFLDNMNSLICHSTKGLVIKANSFDVRPEDVCGNGPVDMYLFDADHSEDSQCRAITNFISAMADQFVFCVDDYDWPDVYNGTMRGIRECNLEILAQYIFKGNDHDNDGFWNGFAVFLLKKKA